MSKEYDELKSLFIKDQQKAIAKSQEIITSYSDFNTYQDFYNYHLSNPHISTCQKEWTDSQMAVHCFECGIDRQACVCLQCFLNGGHQNHDYIIYPNSTGNCDCGDLTVWKHSGCCKDHQGLDENDHPEYYLDQKLRDVLTDVVFKAAFASFPYLQGQKEQNASSIFQFLSSFLEFGDGFRRLLVISLTEKIKFKILLGQVFEYKLFFNKLFQQFCGGLLNDQLFKVNFAMVNYDLLIKRTIPDIFTKFYTSRKSDNYSVWNSFWFHSFSPQPIKAAIEKFNWDWVTFSIKFISYLKTFFQLKSIMNNRTEIPNFFTEVIQNMYTASLVQPNQHTQLFFNRIFLEVLNYKDTIISASFFEMHDDFYYYSIDVFNLIFYPIFECFKLKANLKFGKLMEELDRKIDISPIFCINHNSFGKENDLFIKDYVKKIDNISSIRIDNESAAKVSVEDHFKSFHNGGAFFFTMPLFDSLSYLLRLDNMSRIKISRLLMKSSFKKLRIQLAIVALKKLVALYCCHQSLVSKKNFSIMHYLTPTVNDPPQIYKGIPLVFPLFQLLIGLQSEDDNKLNEFSIKEFFAFEMARELGLFDDFNGDEYKDENVHEKEEQMLSTFLYLSLLLNVERNLFNFNPYYFMEEQIISALKQGISTPAELTKMVNMNNDVTDKCYSYFSRIISKVAKVNSKKNAASGNNDISLSLKDEAEWKPISAVSVFNIQKMLINKEIKKQPKSLFKIQEFDDEEDYFFNTSNKEMKANPEDENGEDDEYDSTGISIKLKEFLFTPTVLTFVYYALRKSGSKIELNDHLAMNILVLISKFVEDSDSTQFDPSIASIHYDSTLVDLISQIKKTLFNFEIKKDGYATITNTLNKQSFTRFLNIKIESDSLEPKSLIDILTNKGEIGKSVLRKLSIDVEDELDQNEKRSIKEINKQRANQLKQRIINQYKETISNYYTNEVDSPEDQNANTNSNEDEEVCSVCSSTIKDQILSYPLFIYKTKVPFIVDKPPVSLVEENKEIGVDEDEKNDMQQDLFKLLRNKKSRQGQSQNDENKSEVKMVEKRLTEGNNFVLQFSICQHLIHQSCVKSKSFKCPIDRSIKNGFLPGISRIDPDSICPSEKVDADSISEPIKNSINLFIENFTSFFSDKKFNLFIELAKSIGGLIETYEIRLRNLPDCLDSSKNKILSRNLFLTSWYAYRILNKPEIVNHSKRLTLFQRFILKLIESDEIERAKDKIDKNEVFNKIVSSFVNRKENFQEEEETRRSKEIFLFLRRVCLTSHFLLDSEILEQNQVKFIDWDEILSVSNLSQKFNVSLSKLSNDFEFKPIVFAKLPKEFLSFAGKPFNFPIEKSSHLVSYNILDYNSLIRDFDDFDDENSYQNDQDLNGKVEDAEKIEASVFYKYFNRNYPTVLLMIGKDASSIFIVQNNSLIKLNPFYLDKFGSADVGFRRKRPLFLNEEKYGRIMDLILSGDFSFYINMSL